MYDRKCFVEGNGKQRNSEMHFAELCILKGILCIDTFSIIFDLRLYLSFEDVYKNAGKYEDCYLYFWP